MTVRADTADALRRELALVQRRDRQPSVVAGVVRDGRLDWSEGRGGFDDEVDVTDLQYRIGSLTKSFTAVLVMQCRADGRLDLDDPVGAHLPDSPWPDTSLRQLLAHAGGVPAEPQGPWWERHDGGDLDDLLARLAQQPRAAAPSTRFHYSNVGYALLGAVVERVRDDTWWTVLHERVLAPLGMHRTSYRPVAPHAQGWSVHPWSGRLAAEPHTDTGAMAPAGQLWSTVEDLARWAAFWLAPTADVLDAASAEQMQVPAVTEPGSGGFSYGLGLQVDQTAGRTRIGHGGSMPGFVAGITVDLEERVAAVAVANATTGGTGQLPTILLDRLHDCEPALPAAWTPEPELPGADELLGPWFWGNTACTLRVRDGVLRLEMGSQLRDSRFVREGSDSWRGLDQYFTGEPLRVVRDGSGTVDHLDLASYLLRREPYA
jgi:CubicO group peptidase (beta-lactamase class C family)